MRTLFVLATIAALCGCKGKPKHRAPPPDFTQQRGSGSAAPDIVLPHGDGSPPRKTAAALSPADLSKLERLAFRGFTIQPRAVDPVKGMEVRQKTEDHPRIIATITISRCGNGGVLGDCIPLDLPKWQAHSAELQKVLPPELRALSDTAFEVGTTLLNKVPMIYTYQLGFAKPGIGSGSSGAPLQSHAYSLYYNDGVNQIRVVAEYGDTPKQTRAELIADVGRDDLEAVAKSFVDIYTQVW